MQRIIKFNMEELFTCNLVDHLKLRFLAQCVNVETGNVNWMSRLLAYAQYNVNDWHINDNLGIVRISKESDDIYKIKAWYTDCKPVEVSITRTDFLYMMEAYLSLHPGLFEYINKVNTN